MTRSLAAAVGILALVSSSAAVLPAAGATNRAVATHKLVVTVKKNLAPAAEKRLAFLILISRSGGAPSGAVATARAPLTVLLDARGFYRVHAELDSACKGSCAASHRISGSADHELELVPRCRPRSSGFVCSKVEIVKVY